MKREWGLMQYDKRQWIVICCHCNTTRDNVKRCSCSKYENKKNGKKGKIEEKLKMGKLGRKKNTIHDNVKHNCCSKWKKGKCSNEKK